MFALIYIIGKSCISKS